MANQNKKQQTTMRMGTWNVNSMYEAGKIQNTIQEMERLDLNILGISEMRWPHAGTTKVNNKTVYYSGNNNKNHWNGVGIIVNETIQKSVINFIPYTDRMLLLQLQGHPITVNVIQTYAPTADKPEAEIETFYKDLRELLGYTKKTDITIIMGDFNAKVGQGRVDEVVGDFGLGVRNERGDKLVEFCQEEQLIVTNTWFKLPPRRLYTWKSPQDNPNNIVRNQIDYILIRKRYRNGVKSVKTYPGADVPSDHNLLMAKVQVRLKKVKKPNKKKNVPMDALKCNKQRTQIAERLNNNLKKIKEKRSRITTHNIEKTWTEMKNAIKNATERLTNTEERSNKPWMTAHILKLMDERRKYKNKDISKYKQVHTVIRKEIKAAKEKWMENVCEEVEEMQQRHDERNIHKKIRHICGMNKLKIPTQLTGKDNKILTDKHEIEEEWKTYIREMFADARTHTAVNKEAESAPPILKSEITHAIKQAKLNKTPGPDEIHTDIIKLISEENLDLMQELFNAIYTTSQFPKEWLQSIFIPLPKVKNPKKCSDFRLISLMSHVLKIFLKIIHNRIYKKCEMDMSSEQFGFRDGLGTREALFGFNVLLQKCRDQQKNIFLCFIDFEKAFDKVNHDKLIECLENKGLDKNDINIIKELYWNQKAIMRTHVGDTDEIDIQRGVRQGCVLSPLLFNLYSDNIFNSTLKISSEGIKVNGEIINNIRYADDTVIIADSEENLQRLLDKITDEGNRWGLRINTKKTKTMVISKQKNIRCNTLIYDRPIEQVSKFKYLGCWIDDSLDPDTEIKARIEQARSIFIKMRPFLSAKNLNLKLRYRMAKCYVYSVLLYGMEAWTLKVSSLRRLESFEMWVFRRILRVPWTDKIRNEEILRRMNTDRELLTSIKRRKTAYLGHVLRNKKYTLIQLIIKGKIEGKRGPGRRQITWLRNIRQWTNMDLQTLIRTAEDRESFANVIANLR